MPRCGVATPRRASYCGRSSISSSAGNAAARAGVGACRRSGRSHASESAVRPSGSSCPRCSSRAASSRRALRSVSWRAMRRTGRTTADTGRAPPRPMRRTAPAAARIDTGGLGRGGSRSFELLWRNDYSEVAEHLVGHATPDSTITADPRRRLRDRGPRRRARRSRWVGLGASTPTGRRIVHVPRRRHPRMDHWAGAVTVHVYSPPIVSIGHYEPWTTSCGARRDLADGGSPPAPTPGRSARPET